MHFFAICNNASGEDQGMVRSVCGPVHHRARDNFNGLPLNFAQAIIVPNDFCHHQFFLEPQQS